MHYHAPHDSGAAEISSVAPEQRKKIQFWLSLIVLPLAAITLIGIFLLWPSSQVQKTPLLAEGASLVTGEITEIGATDEYGQTPIKMRLLEVPDGVEVPVSVPLEIVKNGLGIGSKITAIFTPAGIESGVPYIFYDFERKTPLAALIFLYLLAVLFVAGRKGLAAMVGLGTSLAVVVIFTLPALMAGSNPVLVVVISALAMMFTSIYFAHGISIRTTTAVLGTLAGLVITGLMAWLAIGATNLTGTTGDVSLVVFTQLPNVNLQQLLLAGMILAGLGALNDVTITQASTVWELYAANPQSSRTRLIRQGMVVGRDHIASTVYTLAFAYIGTALPLLLAASLIERGFIDFFLVGEITEEIVRTLVASIGLVLAIPLTTSIAAVLAPVAPAKENK
ncbi:MAG: YibE/F family protein [Arcanobacterium sp.]|nr:YibE/F family protein [Arcanobacterium sp.]